MSTKKFFVVGLLLVVLMLVLGLSVNVNAANEAAEPERKIASEFDPSFVAAVCDKYGITEDEFTWGWASSQEKLELSGYGITGINNANMAEENKAAVLSTYFNNLKVLDLSHNELGGLPNLPLTLEEFYCNDNKIEGLPLLVAPLKIFDCSNNNISALPEFSGELVEFNCSNNNITALPNVMPTNLKVLNCSGNELTALPLMPAGLEVLKCSDNNIEWLGTPLPDHPDGTFPAALKEIDCSNNEIVGIGALPAGLESLNMENNKIDELPILPENLVSLNIKGNDITSFLGSQLPETLVHFSTDLLQAEDGNYYTELPETNIPEEEKPVVEEEKDDTPKTGANLYVGTAVVMLVVATGVAVIARKRAY